MTEAEELATLREIVTTLRRLVVHLLGGAQRVTLPASEKASSTETAKKAARAERNRRYYAKVRLSGQKAEVSDNPPPSEIKTRKTQIKTPPVLTSVLNPAPPHTPPSDLRSVLSASDEALPGKLERSAREARKTIKTPSKTRLKTLDNDATEAPEKGAQDCDSPGSVTQGGKSAERTPLALVDGTPIDVAMDAICTGSKRRFQPFVGLGLLPRVASILRAYKATVDDCTAVGEAINSPPPWMRAAQAWATAPCVIRYLLAEGVAPNGQVREPLLVHLLNHGRWLRAEREKVEARTKQDTVSVVTTPTIDLSGMRARVLALAAKESDK